MAIAASRAGLISRATLPVMAAALGFAFTYAPGTTLFSILLLLPGLVAWWLDNDRGRPTGRAILGFGIAGAYGPLHVQLWQGGSLDLATSLLSLSAIAGAWGAAGAGWLVGWAAGLAFRRKQRRLCAFELSRLAADRRELEVEWELSAPVISDHGRLAVGKVG